MEQPSPHPPFRRRGGGDRGRRGARVVAVRPDHVLAGRSGGRVVGPRSRAQRARHARRRPHRRLRRGARPRRALARRGVRPPRRARARDWEAARDRARGGRGSPRRTQNPAVSWSGSAARRLLESLGYGAVRVFREMRIKLDTPPPAAEWPDRLRVVRSTRSMTRSSFTPRTRRRSPIIGTTRRATSCRGRRATSGASASTRRSGASFARGTSSRPGRSARATRTAAALSTRSSRVAVA